MRSLHLISKCAVDVFKVRKQPAYSAEHLASTHRTSAPHIDHHHQHKCIRTNAWRCTITRALARPTSDMTRSSGTTLPSWTSAQYPAWRAGLRSTLVSTLAIAFRSYSFTQNIQGSWSQPGRMFHTCPRTLTIMSSPHSTINQPRRSPTGHPVT